MEEHKHIRPPSIRAVKFLRMMGNNGQFQDGGTGGAGGGGPAVSVNLLLFKLLRLLRRPRITGFLRQQVICMEI